MIRCTYVFTNVYGHDTCLCACVCVGGGGVRVGGGRGMLVGVSCVCIWASEYVCIVIHVIFLASKDKNKVLSLERSLRYTVHVAETFSKQEAIKYRPLEKFRQARNKNISSTGDIKQKRNNNISSTGDVKQARSNNISSTGDVKQARSNNISSTGDVQQARNKNIFVRLRR